MPDEPISRWIDELKAGDPEAANRLWGQFHGRLVGLVRQKLRAMPRRVVDEEDVVLSAFDSCFRRAQQGQFPSLHDRQDLWSLLVKIAGCKAVNVLKAQGRQKRGGGKVRGESAFVGPEPSTFHQGIAQAPGVEPSPELAAILAEDFERLLAALDDDELRRIAVMKLEGYTTEEIAAKIERSPPTVERRLRLIRERWEEAARQP